MKIMFALNSMGRGGAERVVSILSQEFVRIGHEVTVATQWYSENEYELVERVKRISVGLTDEDQKKSRIQKAFIRLFRLRQTIKKEKPDLVISFCCKANFRCAYSLLGSKIPLIVSVRNNPQEDYATHKLSTWIMERKASGCVFQTPDAQAYFSKKLQRKSVIIFNPLSENYINLPERGENIRKKEIVNVGRISEQKNQMLLLQAFQKIEAQFPEYHLKIFGDIQNQRVFDELTEFCRKHQLEEKVHFLGTTNSLQDEIRDASLFVLSSDYEGMPNALIEALVLGVPSISTDCPCGGSRMLIENNVSGKLVPVRDVGALTEAMSAILSDSEMADRYAKEAGKIIAQVHPQKICQEWMNFIEKVVR